MQKKVFIAGHRGMVGSALTRKLETHDKYSPLLRTRGELDLFDAEAVESFFAKERPEIVLLAAAKVGGIHANNTYPVDFLLENLKIQNNIIESAHRHHTEKLVFLGSSCIYPRLCPQPIKEEYLLTGPLEPTNEPYAIAKITGIRLCQAYKKEYGDDFISVMPTNLYGPQDNFDLDSSHVLPAMIRKFHDAKMSGSPKVTLWGSGTPKREFLHVDDLAEAIVFIMENYSDLQHINIGYGEDISIRDLAETIREVVDYKGEIEWDSTKPDGMPRKLLDSSRIHNLGWKPKISFLDGVRSTYQWYQKKVA